MQSSEFANKIVAMAQLVITRQALKLWRWFRLRTNWQSKLRNRMLLIVLALTALPLCVFAFFSVQKGSAYIFLEAAHLNQNRAARLSNYVDSFFSVKLNRIKAAIQNSTIHTYASASRPQAFQAIMLASPDIAAMVVSDASGKILAQYKPLPTLDSLTDPILDDVPESSILAPSVNAEDAPYPYIQISLQSIQPMAGSTSLTVPAVLTLTYPDHPTPLTLKVYLCITRLHDQLMQWNQARPEVEVILLDHRQRVLFHPRLPFLSPIDPATLANPAGLQKSRLDARSRLHWAYNDQGLKVIRNVTRCPYLGWCLILDHLITGTSAQAHRMSLGLLVLLFVSLFLSLAGSFWFISNLVGPIEELEAGIKLLGNGLLAEPLPVRSQDEIGRLTQNFNHMAQTLIARKEELQGKTRELSFFNEITRIINQSINLSTILDKALQKILQLMHAVTGWIYVYDPHIKKFNLLAQSGVEDPTPMQLALTSDAGENLIFKTYTSGVPTLVRDAAHHHDQLTGLLPAEKLQDLMLVPLRSKKRTMGVMAIASRHHHYFHYRDLDLLARIGGELGVAVENALLYTELQLKIKELEEVNSDLQELDRFKNRILSNVSHELRTPMTSIKTYVELFLSDKIGKLDESQKDKLQIVSRNINHLLTLINDLLTLARIQDQKMQMKNMEVTAIQEVVDLVILDTIEMAKAKGLSLKRDGETHPLLVRINRQKIQQVLQNLISNAIKFTDHGEITVVLEIQHDKLTKKEIPVQAGDEDLSQVKISVVDSGIGIPNQALEKIFQRFYQVDSSSTRKYVGTGLGLAIVKEIIDAHGSEIHVESQLGRGSRFWFTLPLVKPPFSSISTASPPKSP